MVKKILGSLDFIQKSVDFLDTLDLALFLIDLQRVRYPGVPQFSMGWTVYTFSSVFRELQSDTFMILDYPLQVEFDGLSDIEPRF